MRHYCGVCAKEHGWPPSLTAGTRAYCPMCGNNTVCSVLDSAVEHMLPPTKKIHATDKPDDLRADGWVVAVHNDYTLGGVPHTFWLMVNGSRAVRGEGKTDEEALNSIRHQILVGADGRWMKEELAKLEPHQRYNVIHDWCPHCGHDTPCYCMRDE